MLTITQQNKSMDEGNLKGASELCFSQVCVYKGQEDLHVNVTCQYRLGRVVALAVGQAFAFIHVCCVVCVCV